MPCTVHLDLLSLVGLCLALPAFRYHLPTFTQALPSIYLPTFSTIYSTTYLQYYLPTFAQALPSISPDRPSSSLKAVGNAVNGCLKEMLRNLFDLAGSLSYAKVRPLFIHLFQL